MINRPNLPPLRIAVAQFDDPEVLQYFRDHSNRNVTHHTGCSTRLHSDLSFYSLASSSTPQSKSSSSYLLSPKGELLPSGPIDNVGCSSMPPSINHSERRSCGTLYQASTSRQDTYVDLKDNKGYRQEVQVQPERISASDSCNQPNMQFSRSYHNKQSENPCLLEDKPVPDHRTKRYTHSDNIIQCQRPQLEVGKTSESISIQPHPNFPRQISKLRESQVGCSEPGGKTTQDLPEISPRLKIQPTETASGTRYFCPVWGCGKSFTRNFNLTQHISAIHKDERRFQCTYCMALFYRRNDLTRHERSHTGVRPYQCECGQNFTRTDLLTRHKHSGNCTNKRDV
ncbi:hypothetical protein PTTG_06378 [Puccinia triticina 1-1 BBBD Race 1]|uniref:C2H2-type domain-containing protein n=2 Tax=Puccinia triticina TaxID=208348 RepID=A0A180GS03_PUCT1|nr:uncharacterized protein PtA15_10A169 [Puccinia triticina]OAV95540.1 hypothetical protein PTTG_06378 [Puccinia triticina 1-1 BBBD Race 1]WAQ88750.1 hypothetical protein PtA15_10A169 [Puccinia triticina]WAR58813.1 hypothetical protein PtB15_10B152 [Puccinia triticina]